MEDGLPGSRVDALQKRIGNEDEENEEEIVRNELLQSSGSSGSGERALLQAISANPGERKRYEALEIEKSNGKKEKLPEVIARFLFKHFSALSELILEANGNDEANVAEVLDGEGETISQEVVDTVMELVLRQPLWITEAVAKEVLSNGLEQFATKASEWKKRTDLLFTSQGEESKMKPVTSAVYLEQFEGKRNCPPGEEVSKEYDVINRNRTVLNDLGNIYDNGKESDDLVDRAGGNYVLMARRVQQRRAQGDPYYDAIYVGISVNIFSRLRTHSNQSVCPDANAQYVHLVMNGHVSNADESILEQFLAFAPTEENVTAQLRILIQFVRELNNGKFIVPLEALIEANNFLYLLRELTTCIGFRSHYAFNPPGTVDAGNRSIPMYSRAPDLPFIWERDSSSSFLRSPFVVQVHGGDVESASENLQAAAEIAFGKLNEWSEDFMKGLDKRVTIPERRRDDLLLKSIWVTKRQILVAENNTVLNFVQDNRREISARRFATDLAKFFSTELREYFSNTEPDIEERLVLFLGETTPGSSSVLRTTDGCLLTRLRRIVHDASLGVEEVGRVLRACLKDESFILRIIGISDRGNAYTPGNIRADLMKEWCASIEHIVSIQVKECGVVGVHHVDYPFWFPTGLVALSNIVYAGLKGFTPSEIPVNSEVYNSEYSERSRLDQMDIWGKYLNSKDMNVREKRDIMLSLIALKVRLLAYGWIARDCPLEKSEIEKITGIRRELEKVSTETGDGSEEQREITLNRLMALWKNQHNDILSVK